MTTFGKKDKEDKKKQKRKEKERKQEERKTNNNKGKGLDDMLAYVDENGNLSTTPPDPAKVRVINAEDISIAVGKREDQPEQIRTGRLYFFNDLKKYGFIRDTKTEESFFVHENSLLEPIKMNDKVVFSVEQTQRGPAAVAVKKFK